MTKTAIQIVAEMYDAERVRPAQGETDWAYRRALRDVLEALKRSPQPEAAEAAVRDFVGRLHVINDYLVEETGKHTCGTGPDGYYGLHEPGCGYEIITPLSEIRIETR